MGYALFVAILSNNNSRISVTGVIQIYFSYPFSAEILGLKQHHSLIPNTKQRVCLLLKELIFNGHSTGLFISPSGISEIDCATTKTDTAERSISIGRESLQVFFLY